MSTSTPPQSPVDWGDTPPHDAHRRPPRRGDFWTVLRVIVQIFGLLSLAYWGYMAWVFPMPAIVFIIGAPLFAAVIWYLFRSPRSPIENDIVGKIIVEVALVIAAGASWIPDRHPAVGLIFVIVAAISGIVAFRRETAA